MEENSISSCGWEATARNYGNNEIKFTRGENERPPVTSACFTSLSAEETQGRNLREGAATEEHDQNDALGVVPHARMSSGAA